MLGIARKERNIEERLDWLKPIEQMAATSVRFAPTVRLASEVVESEAKARAACMTRHPSTGLRRHAAA